MSPFQVFWLAVDLVALFGLAALPAARGRVDVWRIIIAGHGLAGTFALFAVIAPPQGGFPATATAYSSLPIAYAVANFVYRRTPFPDTLAALPVGIGAAIYVAGGMAGFVLLAMGYAATVAALLLKTAIPRKIGSIRSL